ncbi:Protein-disulfide isomerase [Mesobacillus persicus]|uniref:Protein-disulfide isomerase n=1 Tax=Mesobacillus persicus TaxID=930146 RepID=A0A1H7XVQ9_9BACI|nr:DsbA family protein [Mesobacillus persicus]SEM37986.1 Protein-disulfide isomerase [Mesobacillus persicus]
MAKKNNTSFKIIVVITIIIFAIVTALVMINAQSEQKTETPLETQIPIDGQPILGDPDAPVTVVEFGDYKCPACKAWGDQFFPFLVEEYVETGKVKFVYINVLFHGEESELGSSAAEAIYKQNPESYWEFHKKLFSKQPPSNDHDSAWLTTEIIEEVANTVEGIDIEKLREDMNSQSIAEELKVDSELVEEFNVELTPTVMVNNIELENPFEYELIVSLIEQELEANE